MTATAPASAPTPTRVPTAQRLLVTRPTHFDVVYEINAWMDSHVPVDKDLAQRQWKP